MIVLSKKRHFIWGFALLLAGLFLFAYAESIHAQETDINLVLERSTVCTECHQSAFKFQQLETPCEECHTTKQRLTDELTEAWQELREFHADAPRVYQKDGRYLKALENLVTASTLEIHSTNEHSLLVALDKVEDFQALLSQLENEYESGFWVASPSQKVPPQGMRSPAESPVLKFIKVSLTATPVSLDETVSFAVIEAAYTIQARFLLEITLQRDGPPAETLIPNVGIEKRLPFFRVQSLFYS